MNNNDTSEYIQQLLLEGVVFYENQKYEEALNKFIEAKELDINNEDIYKKNSFIHHWGYHIALVYVKFAENSENEIQERQHYKTAAEYFELVGQNDHDGEYEDINKLIGETLYKAGEKEKALEFLKNDDSSRLIKKIKEELKNDSNELVLYKQDINNNNSFHNYTTEEKLFLLAKKVYCIESNQQYII